MKKTSRKRSSRSRSFLEKGTSREAARLEKLAAREERWLSEEVGADGGQ